MREGEQSDNIHVMVDSSKIACCKWCGIMESESWHHTRYGLFCSSECASASAAPTYCLVFILEAAISLFLFTMAGPAFVGLSVILLTVGVLPLLCAREGMEYRRSVPRNSRENKAPLQAA